MTKGADAFRSIGEVARLLGVAPHVLRYWETQFPLLRPMKRPDGRRYYRPDDVRLAAGLCTVLRDEGLTIRGAKKLLARDRGAAVRERGLARLEGLAEDDMAPLPDPEIFEGLDDEPEAIEPPHGPRARHRRRRSTAGRSPQNWLAELALLRARLHDLHPSQVAGPHHRASLSRLRDALARIC